MKSPHYFIIEPFEGKRYDNVRKYGECEFIISSSLEDHRITQRVGIVIDVPIFYDGPVKKGDLVIVHHNVFRVYYDMSGKERDAWHYYKDGIYLIEQEQLYLYRDADNDKWTAPYPYCFVEPLKKKESYRASLGVEEELMGKVVYFPKVNNSLVSVDDTVSFLPDSEYEFRIDDRRLYRMKVSSLCLKV